MMKTDTEILIVRRLEYLTFRKIIVWEKHRQIYTAQWKNMVFHIEDTKPYFLIINLANGKNLAIIEDLGISQTVKQLLEAIKRMECEFKQNQVDTRTSILGTIFDVLNEGA